MDTFESFNIDAEDYEDLLAQIEKSFQVKFGVNEIENQMTIEEISNMVISKIGIQHGNECATQIVFYRLRQMLTRKLNLDKDSIKIQTKLTDLLPSKGRRGKWNNLFQDSGLNKPKLYAP